MKKQILTLAAIGVITVLNLCNLPDLSGQNIGINSTGAIPNASALLDVDAGTNNLGLLIPRLTTAQRNAIVSPANSLLIFNTTTACIEIYIGTTWQSIYCGCTIPAAPTANAASSIAQTSFTANWATSAGATTYFLDVNTNSTFTGTWILNNFNVGNNVSYNVTGLTCNTTYYYRVRAGNACGTSGNSNIISQVTSSCCVYTPGTQTFVVTGTAQSYTVGCAVTSVTVDVIGAQGGTSINPSGGNGIGGLGGRVQGTITVTPGEVLNIYVGGAGTNAPPYPSMGGAGYNGGADGAAEYTPGWQGAGGGGASDIRRTPYALNDRLVVAGGGGGGGSNGSTPNGNFGGIGGGLNGGSGGSVTGLGQGGGGTQIGGGTEMDYGGFCAETGARIGTLGNGGTACNASAGGGGGGGYYGGGGGEFGGGGGGSSLVPGGGSTTSGYQSGNGQVIITW